MRAQVPGRATIASPAEGQVARPLPAAAGSPGAPQCARRDARRLRTRRGRTSTPSVTESVWLRMPRAGGAMPPLRDLRRACTSRWDIAVASLSGRRPVATSWTLAASSGASIPSWAAASTSWTEQCAPAAHARSCSAQRRRRPSPSIASITARMEISPGGRPSRYPPLRPSRASTSPCRTRSPMIAGRNRTGMACAAAISRTLRCSPSPAPASATIARRA